MFGGEANLMKSSMMMIQSKSPTNVKANYSHLNLNKLNQLVSKSPLNQGNLKLNNALPLYQSNHVAINLNNYYSQISGMGANQGAQINHLPVTQIKGSPKKPGQVPGTNVNELRKQIRHRAQLNQSGIQASPPPGMRNVLSNNKLLKNTRKDNGSKLKLNQSGYQSSTPPQRPSTPPRGGNPLKGKLVERNQINQIQQINKPHDLLLVLGDFNARVQKR